MAEAQTPNYSFNLPTVGGDDNVWGDYLNENWSSIDTILWTVSGVASAALTQAAGDARYLRLAGGTVVGATSFPIVVSPLLSGTSGGAPPALINGPNPGDNSQTVPTTSWVNQAVSTAIGAIPAPPVPPSPSNAAPAMDGTAAAGTSALYTRGDHVHPSDTSRLPLAGGTLTGPLTLAADPAANLQPATKQYVDALASRQNRSRIINGQFRVNQRAYASGTALAAAAYGHDRWKAGASGCTYTFTASGAGMTITITAGSLQQIVENINIEGGTFTLSWTGTAQGRVNAGAYGASPLTATGLPAATAVTVEFNAGTLANVQLELGSQATPFDWRLYGDELALCQRYYETGERVQSQGYYTGAATGWQGDSAPFKVIKRAAPTMGLSGGTYVNAGNVSASAITTQNFVPVFDISAAGIFRCSFIFFANAEL